MQRILSDELIASLSMMQAKISNVEEYQQIDTEWKPCSECSFGCSGSCAGRCQGSGRGGHSF